jgi:hypothetical protein
LRSGQRAARRIRRPLLAIATLILTGMLSGGTAQALQISPATLPGVHSMSFRAELAPGTELAPGQAWRYRITGKAYVNGECYIYRIVPSLVTGDDQTAEVEFTGIGRTETVTATAEQNQGAPLRTACVDTVKGGSAAGFNVANLSPVGGPSVLVYGDEVSQASYVATSLGATDCANVSGEEGQYTIAQAEAFVRAYEHGTSDVIQPLIACTSTYGGFVTDFSLTIEKDKTIQDSQYTYVDGVSLHVYPFQTTCDLTRIDITSAAISCAPVILDGMPAQEFNLFY